MVKVFYHNDADGRCSAFWVRKYLEQEKIDFTADDFIEMNYDKKLPLDKVESFEPVMIVDFSFNMDDFWSLRCRTKNITWIDHHKTAIESIDLDALDLYNCAGIRFDGVAACMLTWFYLFHEKAGNMYWHKCSDPKELMVGAPLFTQYIHLWDTWQWKHHPDASKIEAFITGLNSFDMHPCSMHWNGLIWRTEDLQEIIDSGYDMIRFRDGYALDMCNSTGKTIEFEGIRCFICNMGHVSSEWFKSVDTTNYDALMPFYYNAQTKKFCYSLYGKGDIDLSIIAVKYGGGGHRNACGFQTDKFLF